MSIPQRATRTTISRAIEAADRGAATTLTASTFMSIDDALAVALQLLDTDSSSGRATAYVAQSVLYIGPRKRTPAPTE